MKPLILIGGGGHCKSVIEAAESAGYAIAGVLDMPQNVGGEVLGYPILGTDDELKNYVADCEFVVTVGHIKDSTIRHKIVEKIAQLGGTFATVVASTARVSLHAQIGAGTVVLHGAVVNAAASVGEHCIINTLANVEHDAVVGDFCHISTGAMVNGATKIEKDTFIGSNAMIRESIEIGRNSTIGGGGNPTQPTPIFKGKRPLKLGYFADGPWSHLAFEQLINDPEITIAFVVPRTDTQDATLYNYAQKYGIDYLAPVKINSEDFYNQAQQYGCDLFVSMSFNQIFRPRITNLPPLGTINCHAGKLPFYRGRNILNWALINDEKEFGITVHYIDEGIDTGDIIEQRLYPIDDQDTYKTLLDKAIVACADILYDSIKQIQYGIAKRIEQTTIDPNGFYCGMRGLGDEKIDWNQPSRSLFNFIRAICAPGPMARTSCNGVEVCINEVEYVAGLPTYIGTPGQIVGKRGSDLVVKTCDTVIYITEYSSEIKLKVGDKLR